MSYRRGTKRSAADAAASLDRLTEVHPKDSWLTNKQRTYVSKSGNWTTGNKENSSFAEFTAEMNATNTESRRRPAYGLSELADTLVRGSEDMRALKEAGILGSGTDWLLTDIANLMPHLKTLNSFGGNVVRSEESIAASVDAVTNWSAQLGSNAGFGACLMAMLKSGVRLLHVSHQLLEWSSATAEPTKFAEAIPSPDKQFAPLELQAS